MSTSVQELTRITPANVGSYMRRKRGPVSGRLAIVMMDVRTKEETILPVTMHLGGHKITAEMARQDVAALNYHHGVHGGTGKKIRRQFAFKLRD